LIFKQIEESGNEGIGVEVGIHSDTIIKSQNLSRKEFYSRAEAMKKADIIFRNEGKYFLTTYGKIISWAIELIAKAVDKRLILKVIDLASNNNNGKMKTNTKRKLS
jgi:hypothetical protein